MTESEPPRDQPRDGTPIHRDGTTVRDAKTFGITIRKRVQDVYLGANPELTDGTPQQVGDHIVRVTLSSTGEAGETRKTFSIVGQDDAPFGEYSEITDGSGKRISQRTQLHGIVEGARVTLTASSVRGQGGRVLVSVPNPDLVPPGGRRSMNVSEHDSMYTPLPQV